MIPAEKERGYGRYSSADLSRYDTSLNLMESEIFLLCHISQFSVLSLNDTQMLSGTAKNVMCDDVNLMCVFEVATTDIFSTHLTIMR